MYSLFLSALLQFDEILVKSKNAKIKRKIARIT